MSARKSRRRSSLAPGKIKLQPTPIAGGELYKDIDNGLPPVDRLQELYKRCVEFTVKKMAEEFGDVDFSNKEVIEAYYLKLDDCKKSGVLHRACHKERNIPNPANKDMDASIYNIQEQIHKLKQESENWSNLVRDFEVKCTDAESTLEGKEMVASNLSENIKEAAASYLYEPVNSAHLREQVLSNTRRVPLLIDEYTKTVNLMCRIRDEAQDILNKQVSRLKDVPMESVDSPRTNIQKIVEFSPGT